MTVTLDETLEKLATLANDKMRAIHQKNGAGDNLYGVKMGDIRAVAKKIKVNHELALALWKTKNIDAQLLSTLIIKPKELSLSQIDEMVREGKFSWVADWFNSYVVKEFPDKEKLREKWMNSDNPMAARAGWSLTAGRVSREPEGLDLVRLLDRIENEMPSSPPEAQWTMNTTLAQIGIRFPEFRDRAIAIGEKLGIYRDFPVSKGCTSPFAPIWINEMVSRQI